MNFLASPIKFCRIKTKIKGRGRSFLIVTDFMHGVSLDPSRLHFPRSEGAAEISLFTALLFGAAYELNYIEDDCTG